MDENLSDLSSDDPLALAWNTFQRELPRLIREGETGRFALCKGDRLLSVWDTLRDALQFVRLEFGDEPVLVQEVQPVVKSMRWGYRRLCPN